MSIKSFKEKNVATEIYSKQEGEKLSKHGAKTFNSRNVIKDTKKAKDLLTFIASIKSDPLKEFAIYRVPARCKKFTSGKYKGYYSVRINEQLRICFKWGTDWNLDSNAYEVEINKHYGD